MSALLRADWYSMGSSSAWAVGVGAGAGACVGEGGWVSFSFAGIAEGFKGAALETLAGETVGEAAEGEGVVSAGESVVSAGRGFSSRVSDKAFGTLASLEEKSP